MNDRVATAFLISSVMLLAVLGLAWLKNDTAEHRQFQRAFQRLIGAPPAALTNQPDGLGVAQFWLPPLDRADRCITCHLGVDDPRLRDAALPFRLHSEVPHVPIDFNRFGCVSCHGGQSYATTADEAHGRTAHWPSPLLDARDIESRCGHCHSEMAVPVAPALTRGRALIARLGCANCHAMGTQLHVRVTAPPLEGLSTKVTRAWLRRWLKNPKEVDQNAKMPNFHLNTSEIDALTEYLLAKPPAATLQRPVQQAAQESDGDPEAGARLFRTLRCITCHTLEGKGHGSAPELLEIGSKASKGWLHAFMKDTHAVSPLTIMPSYTLSSADLRDIVAYMAEELRNFDEPVPAPLDTVPVNEPLAREGRAIFEKYGCDACHATAQVARDDVGPDLSGIGAVSVSSVDFGARRDLPRRLPAWLKAKVIEPRSFGASLKMPSFPLADDQAADVVTALLSLSRERIPDELAPGKPSTPSAAALPPAGDVGRLFTKYRCLSCHLIGNAGTDLSTAALTFQGSKTRPEWLAGYLMLPDTIYPLLTERMPVLGITPAEARQIADYISTVYVDDAVAAAPSGSEHDPVAVARGATLFADKGCRSCHILGKAGGYVGPPLSGAGDRLQSAWIGFWLENPQRWRRESRCPNYGLTREEIIGFSAFLSSQHAGEGGQP